jgi:hypothetical protein
LVTARGALVADRWIRVCVGLVMPPPVVRIVAAGSKRAQRQLLAAVGALAL